MHSLLLMHGQANAYKLLLIRVLSRRMDSSNRRANIIEMLRFTIESKESNGTKTNPNSAVTQSQVCWRVREREREMCPSMSVLHKKFTNTHTRKKCQAQENGRDIGALRKKHFIRERKKITR